MPLRGGPVLSASGKALAHLQASFLPADDSGGLDRLLMRDPGPGGGLRRRGSGSDTARSERRSERRDEALGVAADLARGRLEDALNTSLPDLGLIGPKGAADGGERAAAAATAAAAALARLRPRPPAPPPYTGACPGLSKTLLDEMAPVLRRTGSFALQEGVVDFGLLGDEADTAICDPSCAYNNPSSPYGLVLLPLSPSEDLAAKLQANSTPGYVVRGLQANNGAGRAAVWQLRSDEVVVLAGCTPIANASRYFGATHYLYSTWLPDRQRWLPVFASMGDSLSVVRTPSGASAGQQLGGSVRNRLNVSSVGPLRTALGPPALRFPARVDLLAQEGGSRQRQQQSGPELGQAPPEQPGLRQQPPPGPLTEDPFDAFTLVVMGADPATVAAAAEALDSGLRSTAAAHDLDLPDSFVGALPIPGPEFGAGLGLQPHSSYYMLLLRNIVPSGDSGLEQFKSYLAAAPLRVLRLTPLHAPPPSMAPPSSRPGLEPSSPAAGGVGGLLRSSVMQDVLAAVAAAGSTAHSFPLPHVQPRAAGGQLWTAGGEAHATELGAGGVDQDGAGLAAGEGGPEAVHAGSSQPQVFALLQAAQQVAAQLRGGVAGAVAQEGSAERHLPPTQPQPHADARGRIAGRNAGVSSDGAGGIGVDGAGGVSIDGAGGVSSGGSSGGGPGEVTIAAAARRQAPAHVSLDERLAVGAFDFLVERLASRYSNASFAVAHALGSSSTLEMMGVDWGLDCLRRGMDACNGDNRDCQYMSSFPLVSLDRLGQVLVLVGANHVATGAARYLNVGLTDPIQRQGLAAFDDQELAGSAAQHLAGTPHEALSPLLYVVVFARNCTGIPSCKPIHTRGLRSAPLPRPLLTISRAYVNPATGVGPSVARLLTFHAMLMTPGSVATPADSRSRLPAATWRQGPGAACSRNLAGLAQCGRGSRGVCCESAAGWAAQGGGNGSSTGGRCACTAPGRALLSTMPPFVPTLLGQLGGLCGVEYPSDDRGCDGE